MQDGYVGDIGDFGKYALLKSLVREDIVLGIMWYLTDVQGGTSDGRFVQYLSSPDEADGLGACDLELFSKLEHVVDSGDRRVARVREDCILPPETVFYEDRLNVSRVPWRKRPQAREGWFKKGLKVVDRASLVFLDPDNGLSLNERVKFQKTGPKHVVLDEIREFLSRGQSLVVYCHQDRRRGGLDVQVREGIELFRRESQIHKAWAFSFHRRAVRIFFIVPARESMAQLLTRRSADFKEGPFGMGGHFRPWALP
jgi:hypothetical protein